MYVRWYADNMWLMVPAQEFVKNFFGSIKGFPFQSGGTLSASNIGYETLSGQKAQESLNKLLDLEFQN